MPYAFAPRAESELGSVSRWDVPINQWMGLKFAASAHNTLFSATSRREEDRIWDGPDIIQPDFANKMFGVPGHLVFDAPLSIQRARLMRERKDEELMRAAYFSAATHSAFSIKGAAGLAASLAGGISNPLDFASMFIPFAGMGGKVAGVAKMGGRLGPARTALAQGFERGLISQSSLAAATRFPRFSAAVINGTFGNAVTEIPVFLQNTRDQADYGPKDSLLNIALGGVAGGGLHLAGAAFGRALNAAGLTHSRLDPEMQEAASRQAINDMLDNQPISADRLARLDSGLIMRDLQFDEARARAEAMTKVGVLPEEARARAIIETLNKRQASAVDLLDMARFKSNTDIGAAGKIAKALISRYERGDRGLALFKSLADLFDVRYNPTAHTIQERLKNENLWGGYAAVRDASAESFKAVRRELYQSDVVIRQLLNDITKSASTKASAVHRAEIQRLVGELGRVEAGRPGRDALAHDHRAYQKQLAAVHREIQLAAKQLARADGDPLVRQLSSNLFSLQQKRDRLHEDWLKVESDLDQRAPISQEDLDRHSEEMERNGFVDDPTLRVQQAQLEARADEVRAERVQQYIADEQERWQAQVEGRVSAAETAQIVSEINKGKILTDEQVTKLLNSASSTDAAEALAKDISNLEAEIGRKSANPKLDEIVAAKLAAVKEAGDEDFSKAFDIARECLLQNMTLP